ncbi:MAG TPA: TIM barrel protein [Verrucomicrobiae bacterium]|nr:TIM barrel protein [Verrucomicrobiae bacterium]
MKLKRRDFLKCAASSAAALSISPAGLGQAPAEKKKTNFQVACMTLPYAQFPLERALTGIRDAGFKFVAWYTSYRDEHGKEMPVVAPDDPPERARELGKHCRDLGLEPVLIFSGIYPENERAIEIFTSRVEQASAAGIPQVLTFGHTKGANRELWIKRFKQLAPVARDHGVMIVIKQHGGETGTGAACAEIVREIGQDSIQVNYDAGNVMDYLDVDPLGDIKTCVNEIRSFCVKDHRNFPKDEDCGPGFGEIDHYKLLSTVAFTGLTMPLCCENIFAPVLPRPKDPAGVDAFARRAREFLDIVITGLQG